MMPGPIMNHATTVATPNHSQNASRRRMMHVAASHPRDSVVSHQRDNSPRPTSGTFYR
jgi:hypothetical protein